MLGCAAGDLTRCCAAGLLIVVRSCAARLSSVRPNAVSCATLPGSKGSLALPLPAARRATPLPQTTQPSSARFCGSTSSSSERSSSSWRRPRRRRLLPQDSRGPHKLARLIRSRLMYATQAANHTPMYVAKSPHWAGDPASITTGRCLECALHCVLLIPAADSDCRTPPPNREVTITLRPCSLHVCTHACSCQPVPLLYFVHLLSLAERHS